MIEFKLPSLGADMEEGKLLEWHVKPGDTVKRGQVVAVVDTSKAAVDVEIWQDGVMYALLVQPGETVPVGTVLATLLAPGEAPDEIRWLLNQALTGPVTFLPFACGTMTHWEYDLYEKDLPRNLYNTRWWEYAARYQGLEPPTPRGEQWCDAATKTHVIDDPAQY